jgi:hypothetical protein
VASSLDRASHSDVELLHAAFDAAAGRLDSPGAESGPHTVALLALLSRSAALLRAAGACSTADPDALQYSLIRKLVGRGAHAAALSQGWELFEALEGQEAAPRRQGHQQHHEQRQKQREALLVGAVINLVVCTAEAGVPEPSTCGRLGAAAERLAMLLR